MQTTDILLTCLGSIALLAIVFAFLKRGKTFKRAMDMTFLQITIAKKESDQDEKKETAKDFREQIGLMEQLLASLRALGSESLKARLFGQDYLSLEYVAHNQEILFFLVIPKKAKILVEKQITSFYPDAIVEEKPEIDIFANRTSSKAVELTLKKEYFLPIHTHKNLESDPINTIIGAISKLTRDESCIVQILLRPTDDHWQEKAVAFKKKLEKGHGGFFSSFASVLHGIFSFDPDNGKDAAHDKHGAESIQFVDEKRKKSGYECAIRIVATGNDPYTVESQAKNIASAFSQYSLSSGNSLKEVHSSNVNGLLHDFVFRYFPGGAFHSAPILNLEEIASMYHFPHTKYNRAPEIKWQNFKIVKAPNQIATEGGILLGTNVYRTEKREIRVKTEDRFRHFYVIGQTGTGKSSILQVMARQDIQQGNGLAIMDPHGDLAEDLFPFIPRERADDVVYFNPSDLSRPMGLNLFEASTDDEKQTVAQDSMNIMIKLFGNEIFGPRIQDYFRNGALTLMDYPAGGALTDIVRLFTDDEFQKERRRTLKNPIVKAWWDYTFAKMGDREKAEIIPYFQAKFGGFITNTLIRNIIGQTKSSFNVADIMQQKKILMINLSKGTLGDLNSQLLGMILVSKIQMAAMKRQNIDKSERQDFFLYIDEFQNFVTDSIESILSEARKYRLGLILAHQYIGQLQKNDALTKSNLNLKDAIFGNVGSIMSYKIGPEDAEFMAKQFMPEFSDQDLKNMDKFKAIMKLSVDGQPTTAFSLIPVNPYLESGDKKLAKAYKELSRLKYGREREFVEKEIIFRIGAV